jgi:uncharacterized Ntn-hydrolase superfamily protein
MTYSIAAADTTTQQVGGAGTSCLMGDDVYVIYQAVPGHGVVHAQAYYNAAGRRRAAALLEQGKAPEGILAELVQPTFDHEASLRQYGIVDVLGRTAAFTGSDTMPFANAQQGSRDGFAYSVQGNILTSRAVLSQAAAAFESTGCDLAERLMTALEAGAKNGEGDKRCTPSGIPSDSAFLQVEAPGTAVGSYLSLRVKTSGHNSPLPLLREKLDAWREQHPCPKPATPPADSESDSGCSCHVAAHGSAPAPLGALCFASFLLGSLLVVVRRRQRAPRQLAPTHTA